MRRTFSAQASWSPAWHCCAFRRTAAACTSVHSREVSKLASVGCLPLPLKSQCARQMMSPRAAPEATSQRTTAAPSLTIDGFTGSHGFTGSLAFVRLAELPYPNGRVEGAVLARFGAQHCGL